MMQHELLVLWTSIVLMCLWDQLCIVNVAASVVNTDNDVIKEDRRPDLLFRNVTHHFNGKLTCENMAPSGGSFPTETWSCHNMKINGSRLRYWYISGFGEEKDSKNGDDDYNMKNDYGSLCEQLLRRHGVTKPLWAAFVDDASSQKTVGPRVIFIPSGNSYMWQEYPAGRGYVKTLRCMTKN